MFTQVGICNRALTLVGGNTIASVDDLSVEARTCKQHYDDCVLRALNERAWTFATKRRELNQVSEEPVFKYRFGYQLPSDCMRVLTVADQTGRIHTDWVREGQLIKTDYNTVFITYVSDEVKSSPNLFPPMFQSAVVYLLASRLAIPIASSTQLEGQFYEKYQFEIREVGPLDATQGSPTVIGRRANTLIKARFR